jgi:hypothetical protein
MRCPVQRIAILWLCASCATTAPAVRLTADWPDSPREYDAVVGDWTRTALLRGEYQEVCQLVATLKSPEWLAAFAAHDADGRGLTGDARAQRLAQARADAAAGPYEIEVMVTTWDRRENDLDRGARSVWHVALIDDQGHEIAPVEIVRDRRPAFIVRAEFPGLGEFATPYVARFARTAGLFGPTANQVRLRMSSTRGGLEVRWASR